MILVDTHILIWDALEQHKLSKPALRALNDAEKTQSLGLCDISLWEIALLLNRKRLQTPLSHHDFLETLLQVRPYQILPICPDIAITAVNLPEHINKDPADGMIVATALSHKAKLITADENLQKHSGLTIIW
jgi:PIN domain nuclease of toxin-antitoxin system